MTRTNDQLAADVYRLSIGVAAACSTLGLLVMKDAQMSPSWKKVLDTLTMSAELANRISEGLGEERGEGQ